MTNPITGELLEAFKLLLDPDMAEDESLDEHEVMEKAYKALNNYNPDKLEQVREILALLIEWQESYSKDNKTLLKQGRLYDLVRKHLDPEIKAWALGTNKS